MWAGAGALAPKTGIHPFSHQLLSILHSSPTDGRERLVDSIGVWEQLDARVQTDPLQFWARCPAALSPLCFH